MATYYCDPSLTTGLNNGSSIANAWQDLKLTIENNNVAGTPLTAGDIVYIACRDTTDTSNITLTSFAGFNPSTVVGTDSAHLTFIFDADGTIFGRSAGVLTVEIPGNNVTVNFKKYTSWYGNQGFHIKHLDPNTTSQYGWLNAHLYEVIFQLGDATHSSCNYLYKSSDLNYGYLTDCILKVVQPNSSAYSMFNLKTQCGFKLKNFTLDFTEWLSGKTYLCHKSGAMGAVFICDGLYIKGALALNGLKAITNIETPNYNNGTQVIINGLKVDTGVILSNEQLSCPTSTTDLGTVGIDNKSVFVKGGEDINDFSYGNNQGNCQWQKLGNFPVYTLGEKIYDNTDVNLATPYSVKVYPSSASRNNPFSPLPFSKFFTDSVAAIKTLEFEIAYINSQTPTNKDLWVEVTYVRDSDGMTVCETTRPAEFESETVIPSSPNASSWNPNPITYSTLSYNALQITHTTTSAIKPLTEIKARLYCGLAVPDTNSFWFYNQGFKLV